MLAIVGVSFILVFTAFLLSGRQHVPGSFCRFLIPNQGFSHFSKDYWFFSVKYSAIIICMLKVLIATEFVTVFRPLQPRKLGNIYSLKQKKIREFILIHFFPYLKFFSLFLICAKVTLVVSNFL